MRSRPPHARARSATARSSSHRSRKRSASARARPIPMPCNSLPAVSRSSDPMKFRHLLLPALGALALGLAAVEPALAQDAAAAAPTVNKGDTTWMLVSTILVILMTIPGLALFYGGLVRTKNMLSVLMQVFAVFSLVAILWVFYGYSLAFTSGGEGIGAFIGGFSKAFLAGVT